MTDFWFGFLCGFFAWIGGSSLLFLLILLFGKKPLECPVDKHLCDDCGSYCRRIGLLVSGGEGG